MANFLNRTTRQYVMSADPAEHPVVDWIINPDVSSVAGFRTVYWIVTGDVVTLMDQAARDAVDAAEIESGRDETMTEIDDTEALLRAFAQSVMDELNILRAEYSLAPLTLAQLRTAMRNKFGT